MSGVTENAAAAGTKGRLVRNLGALSLAALLSKPLTYATTLVVARLLGPSTMGLLVVAQTFVGAGSLFSDLGLTVLTMRDIVEHPQKLSRLVTATATVQVIASLAISVILGVLAVVVPLPHGAARLLLLTLPLPLCVALNTVYALQALEDMNRVAIQRLLAVVVTSVGTVALVSVDRSATWPALMAWIGVLAADGLAAFWLWKRHRTRPTRVSWRECLGLTKRSVPFVQNGVLVIILAVVDTASLAVFGTAKEVGVYGVVWSTTFSAFSLVLLVTDATYPEMVRRWGQSAAQLKALVDQLVAVTLRVLLVATALVVAEAPTLVRLTLGNSYNGSIGVFRILIWMVPIGSVGVIVSFALLAAGQQKKSVRLRLPTLVVFVIGCPIAAIYGGVDAVAAVVLAGTLIEGLFFCNFGRRFGVASALRQALGQFDYLLAPLVVLFGADALLHHVPLYYAIALWLGAALIVESTRKFSTVRVGLVLVRRRGS